MYEAWTCTKPGEEGKRNAGVKAGTEWRVIKGKKKKMGQM